MGGGGKGGTSTSTVSIPPEVLARYNAVNAKAEDVAKTPFKAYSTDPNAFVASLSDTQQAGIANTNAAAGAAQPFFSAAAGQYSQGANAAQGYNKAATSGLVGGLNASLPFTYAGGQSVNAQQFSPNAVNQYMNPYMNAVIGGTLAPLQQQQAMDQQALTGKAIGAGAFGGNRADLAQAALRGQQQMATGNVVGNLLNQGYGQAVNEFNTQQGVNLAAGQANRQALQQTGQNLYNQYSGTGQALAGLGNQVFNQGVQGANTVAGLGTGAQNAALQGAQAQLTAGQQEQATKQAGLTALYNQFLQQQSYPFQTTQFLANIAEGTGALSGSTTTNQQPSSFFSDERLKTDIERIGETYDGQKIIKFRYKGEKGPKQIGLVAQDVEKHHPEAVGESHGYKTVDYDAATRDAAKRGHFYEGGLAGASMGGNVHVGDDRLGFGLGGGLPNASDQSMDPASAQAQSYAAMAKPPITPPPTGLNIPMQAPPNRGLVLGQFRPQQPTGMQSALNDASSAIKVAEGGSKLYDWFNESEEEDPEVKEKDTGITTPKKSSGGLAGDREHYSTQGSIPYEEDAKEDTQKQGVLDIPNEPNQYKLVTPQNAGQMQKPGTLGDAAKSGMQMYSAGKKAMDLGTKAADFLGGGADKVGTATMTSFGSPVTSAAEIGPFMSEAPAGISALAGPASEGVAAATGAGAAAEGAGLLGTIGEGIGSIMSFLPMLFLASGGAANARHGYALEGEVKDEPRQPDPDLVQLASADPAAIDLAKKVTTPKDETTGVSVAAPAPATVVPKDEAPATVEPKVEIPKGVVAALPAVTSIPQAPAPAPKGLVPTPDKKPAGIPATKGNILDASAAAIKGIESSGNYDTVGPKVVYKGGPYKGMEDYAYGAYGVMGVNVGPWTKEALGKEMTPEEFRKDKDAQDAVFKHQFGQLVEKHGNPLDAASVWFSGKTRAEDDGRRDVLGTSIPGYVKKFATATGLDPNDPNAPTTSRARSSENVGKESTTLGSIVSQITHQAQKVLPESHEGRMALLSGIFGMLASPSPYLLNAIGQGGLAGVNAYAAAQRQQNDMLKTNLQILNNNFSTIDGETFVNKMNGETYTKDQMKELYKKIVGRTDSGKTILGALESAKGTKPSVLEIKPPPATEAPAPVGTKPQTTEAKPATTEAKPATAEAPPAAGDGQGTATATPDGAKPPATTSTAPQTSPAVVKTESGEFVAQDIGKLMQQRAQDTAYWDKGPPELHYPNLIAEANKLQKNIENLEAQAAKALPFNSSAASRLTAQANSQRQLMNDIRQRATTALKDSIAPDLDRLAKERDIEQRRKESGISTEQQITVQKSADELIRQREEETARRNEEIARKKFEEELRLKNENELVTVFPSLTGNAVSMTKAQLLEANKQRAAEGQQPLVTERNPIAVKKMEEVMKNDTTMDEQQQNRQVLRQRTTALKDVIEKMETGKFSEQKNELAKILKSAGFPDINTDTIQPAEFDKLVKNSIAQVYDQAKAIGNKVLVAEIQGLSKAVVGSEISPEANRSILAQLEGVLNYQDHHHKDYMNYRMANPDDIYPEQFNDKWRRDKEHNLNDYVKDAEKHIAPKGVKPPNPDQIPDGQKYWIMDPKTKKETVGWWDANSQKFKSTPPARKYTP